MYLSTSGFIMALVGLVGIGLLLTLIAIFVMKQLERADQLPVQQRSTRRAIIITPAITLIVAGFVVAPISIIG